MLRADQFFVYPDPANDKTNAFVILSQRSPRWFITNRTGLEICQILTGTQSVAVAEEALVQRHGISQEAARHDVGRVADFLGTFLPPSSSSPDPQRLPNLRSLFLHLTTRCNLSCSHCYVEEGQGSVDLPLDVVLDLIDQLAEAGGQAITLSGGEPLCHEQIEDIVNKACSRVRVVRLLTNGTLITHDLAARLAHPNLEVQVSLDGPSARWHDDVRGPGTFERTIAGISVWKRVLGPEKLTLCATMTADNLASLPSLVDVAAQRGVARLRFLPLRLVGRARTSDRRPDIEEYRTFLQEIVELQRGGAQSLDLSCGVSGLLLSMGQDCTDDIWCPVGRQIVVDPEGDAYPCVLLMRPEFRLGGVRETRLEQLIHADPMKHCCRALTERPEKVNPCADCNWRRLCQAGCMGQALDEKGTIWATDQFCDFRLSWYSETFDSLLNGYVRNSRG